jgi:predicted ATPase
MKRYVLTGAPGAGQTSVLRALRDRGFAVIEEAATDVITIEQRRGADEPWRSDDFIDKIVRLQRDRRRQPPQPPTANEAQARAQVRVRGAGA